jgi:hypothetical protein
MDVNMEMSEYKRDCKGCKYSVNDSREKRPYHREYGICTKCFWWRYSTAIRTQYTPDFEDFLNEKEFEI